jgi:hypothetical protein
METPMLLTEKDLVGEAPAFMTIAIVTKKDPMAVAVVTFEEKGFGARRPVHLKQRWINLDSPIAAALQQTSFEPFSMSDERVFQNSQPWRWGDFANHIQCTYLTNIAKAMLGQADVQKGETYYLKVALEARGKPEWRKWEWDLTVSATIKLDQFEPGRAYA